MNRLPRAVAALVCLPLFAPLPACPNLDHQVESDVLGPVVAGDQLLFADRFSQELIALTLADGDATGIRRVALSGPTRTLAVLPDGSAALSLNATTETLDRIPLTPAGPSSDVVSLELGAPFEALVVSPDSDAAIAFFPPGTATTVFHNTNEIAFVDLRPETPVEDAVTRRTLASLGGAPRSVHPSPEVDGRRYAFVLSDEHVAVLDLSAPDTRERSVPLVSLNTGGQRTPLAIEFAIGTDNTGESVLWGVVTVAEDNAVYALKITPTLPTGPQEPAFDVQLSQLGGFSAGGQVTLVREPDGDLVTIILNPAQGMATVTKLSNGFAQSVVLSSGINRLDVYTEGDRPIALIYRQGSTTFHILDVAELRAKKDKAFRTRTARQPIASLLPVPGTPLFFAFHDDANEAVSVIDADTDRVTSFGRTGTVRQAIIAQDLGRAYFLTQLGSDSFLVSVQLDNLHPESSPIPGGADTLHVMPAAGTVVASRVDEATLGGHLVLWPALFTVGDASRALPGVLLTGLVDRAAE
ncbi:MAG: hypothetical protein ACI9MR_001816 [Myxococcota bacterium]|jgi:hypothetical protein